MIGNRIFAIAAALAVLAVIGPTAVLATTDKSRDRLAAMQSGNDKPAKQPNAFTVTSIDLYGIDKFSIFAPLGIQQLPQSATPRQQREEFMGFDRNGDGQITVSEWIEPIRTPKAEAIKSNETVLFQGNRAKEPNSSLQPPQL